MQRVEDHARLSKQQRAHLDRIKQIKDRYANGEPLTGADAKYVYMILTNHPNASQKIGSGVRAIFVAEYIFNTRCFFVLRKDGSVSDFSASKVIRGKFEPHSAHTLIAMTSFNFGQIYSTLARLRRKTLQHTRS
jgi:exopolysaccharide biosynthesis predicted pyruvyltransferase EpsI